MALIIHSTNRFKGRDPRRRDLVSIGGAQLLDGSNAQPDQAQFAEQRARELPENFQSIPQAQGALNNRNIPTQLRYTPFFILIERVANPVLLLPANPARCGYIIDSTVSATAVQFSFGYPVPGLGGNFIGLSIPVAQPFQESNGSCSIDNIWVWSNNQADVGENVIGYEGVLAIESLQHQIARSGPRG